MKAFFQIIILLAGYFGYAQIGIGTTNPTPGYNLDVNGDLLVRKGFKVSSLPTLSTTSGTFKFLYRSFESGEIMKLDMGQLSTGPVNLVDYHFSNLNKDNLTAVNLNYDASKYVLAIGNIRYVGAPIEKAQIGSSYLNMGNFVARVYVNSGKWYLEMRNRSLDALDDSVEYYVTVVIYNKTYFKQLPPITVDFNGWDSEYILAPSGL